MQLKRRSCQKGDKRRGPWHCLLGKICTMTCRDYARTKKYLTPRRLKRKMEMRKRRAEAKRMLAVMRAIKVKGGKK